jgi:hypothetical protein
MLRFQGGLCWPFTRTRFATACSSQSQTHEEPHYKIQISWTTETLLRYLPLRQVIDSTIIDAARKYVTGDEKTASLVVFWRGRCAADLARVPCEPGDENRSRRRLRGRKQIRHIFYLGLFDAYMHLKCFWGHTIPWFRGTHVEKVRFKLPQKTESSNP